MVGFAIAANRSGSLKIVTRTVPGGISKDGSPAKIAGTANVNDDNGGWGVARVDWGVERNDGDDLNSRDILCENFFNMITAIK